MRPWQHTGQDGQNSSDLKKCRSAFVYIAEFLEGVSAPPGTRPTASSSILHFFRFKSSSPQLGIQARQPEKFGVFCTSEQ